MKTITLLLSLLSIYVTAQKQDHPAYLIYKDGKVCSWEILTAAAGKADLVFFGEFHNNPIHHWLQIELTKELHKIREGNIILGAEMFETDNQLILDEYLLGLIRERNFNDEARLWPNYATDYKPLVEFARENKLAFIATNVPRRYAAVVSQGGFEALEKLRAEALQFLPPLPIPYDPQLPGYAAMEEMAGMGGKQGPPMQIAKAQALKDATMAWFILKYFIEGYVFIHFNGAYHSDNKEGIVWYIHHYASISSPAKKFNIVTISGYETDDMSAAPTENKADFIIVTPSSMTTTH